MMSFLTALIDPLFRTIDHIIEDRAEAEKIKLALQQEILVHRANEFKAAADIIVAEAKGESWLQRSWRPMLMLWFASLIGAHWLGFTAPNISDEILNGLLDIVKIGIGGYVIGRSTEKVVKQGAELAKTISATKDKPQDQYRFNN